MKNWKNSVYALFAMMCVLIFAGCQPMSGGTKPTGTVPGSTGGNDLNAVEKAIVGSFKLPDGIVFKFNSDRTGTKTTPASGNIRAAQPVLNFTWKADTSGNVSITFKDGTASPVVKFNVDLPNEIKIDGVTATRYGATDLNEYERKLVGKWYSGGADLLFNEDKTLNWVLGSSSTGGVYTAKATWNSTVDTLTLNWYEATSNGQFLSGQEKENFFQNYFHSNPTVYKYTWNANDNIYILTVDVLMSRKPHYVVQYYYSDLGTVKTEYVEIGEDYNINFDYGENLFVHASVPQKYWNSSDWVFEKYEMYISGGNKREYRPGDSAKIQSPTAYASYSLSIRGTDNRADVIIGYKTNGNHKGDTYWFYDGNSYTKRNGTWYRTGGGSSGGTDPRPNDGYTAKAGNIISSAYIQNRERELKCIGFVKSSLTSISASDIYERADPAIGWTVDSPIDLVPVFAAQ